MSGPLNRFYVYEHWRPDTDMCFWIGKGTGDRAYRFKRNPSYNRVVKRLASMGMCVEVRLVASSLTEEEAYSVEADRISFWRASFVFLTNRTDGGDGNRGMMVSDATKEKLRRANVGRKHSAETREKMSAAQLARARAGNKSRGRPAGFKHSEATIEKMTAAQLGHSTRQETRDKLRNANLGKKHSPETIEKMRASRLGNTWGRGGKGLKRSEETKKRMSMAQAGHAVSDETRAKISTAAKARAALKRETVA